MQKGNGSIKLTMCVGTHVKYDWIERLNSNRVADKLARWVNYCALGNTNFESPLIAIATWCEQQLDFFFF